VPRGWSVKSIRYDGKEIVDEPTEFNDNSDPSALEVVLSNRGAVVTGRVVDDSGNAVAARWCSCFGAMAPDWTCH